MINKTYTKILSLGIGIVLVTSIIVVYVFHFYYEKQAQENLKTVASIVSSEINSTGDYAFINSEKSGDTRFTVIDKNGTVLADSAEDAEQMENHSDRPEFKEAVANGQGSTIRKSATIGENTFYYAVKLSNGNVLRVSVTSESVYVVFYNSIYVICAITFAVILISLALSFAITKSIINPVIELGKNLDNIDEYEPFPELKPFAEKLREEKKKRRLLDNQKKQFTANISHELKTPLTSIAGYAELIENGMAKPEDVKPFAHTIRNQALRLVSLTEDIIQLSQLEEFQNEIAFQDVDISRITEKCAHSLQVNALSKNISIETNLSDCEIKGNPSLIEEMIYNLIDNAVRYNKENGKIEISVSRINESAVFSITDTGIGIPEKYQERVFERFFRVDKSRSKETGGTGLGLAIVKHIAEVHNAEISVFSKENIGTTIKIKFPM